MILLAALLSCSTENRPTYDLIIQNSSLIDGTGSPVISNVHIYVQNGRISQITSAPIENAVSDNVIAGKGKYIIPGLFDAHFHLMYNPGKFERTLQQLIHFGVTGILIPGGSLATYENLAGLKQLEQEGQMVTPHLFYTSLTSTLEGGHPMKMYGASNYIDSVSVHIVQGTDHIRSIVLEAAENNVSGIKIMIEDGPMPPLTPRMPPEYISAFTEAGNELNLPVFAHISDMEEVKMGVEGGVDAFMHFMGVLIDWEEDQSIIDQIVSDNISWVTTGMLAKSIFYPLNKEWLEQDEFSVFEQDQILPLTDPEGRLESESRMILSDFFGSESVPMEAVLQPMMSDLKRLYDEGVNIVLGTDVAGRPYILPGVSVHEEMQLLQLGGFTPEEIIRISSYNAAQMLGISDDYGSIEEGKIADMIFLNEDPAEDISNTLSIETVIKEGKIQERLNSNSDNNE